MSRTDYTRFFRTDYTRFFRDYAAHYTQALGENPNYQAIMDCFTECFIGAGPDGVECASKGGDFRAQLQKNFAFYRKLGARRMDVVRVEASEIDPTHDLVRVFYRGAYARTSSEEIDIDFDVSYLLDVRNGRPHIFAFVAGDEMGLYRSYGLVDAAGQPA